MNTWLNRLSLRSKLILSGVLPSFVALVLAASAFVVYDFISYRKSLVGNLEGAAHFLALTTRASVRFGQPEFAEQLLRGLESNEDVLAACLYDEEGTVFAKYQSKQAEGEFPALASANKPAPQGHIWVFVPILLGTEKIGTVFIDGGYGAVWQRLTVVASGAAASLLLFSLCAYALAALLQRHISTPLANLAQAAERISSQKDYSVRVDPERAPEFAKLTDAFNDMLGQIQARDEELRSRARDLEAANKELEAFTYTVSHDLRSPLRSVAGFSSILDRQFGQQLDAEGRELVRRIRGGAERMGQLIDDLLAFSRLGAEPLRLEKIDPAEIARRAYQQLAIHDGAGGAKVTIDPMPATEADPALIEQVYTNLLSNALKYSRSRAGAEVHAGSRQQDGKAIYFVRDNGVGFDMQHAGQLFKVFHRLHRSEEFEGTGVGLAIVQRIIARHGGKIWPEAERGKGATFFFTLN